MAFIVKGPVYGSSERDKEGYRTWNVKHLVLSDVPCGPASALRASALPRPGQMYLFDDDLDPWAWCGLEARITPHSNSPRSRAYWVEQPFTTKPNLKWCKDQQIEDPLLQPPKISGNFIRYTEEATFDRFGNFLTNSAWEQIRGPQVEFDSDRIQIEIEQNVINLDLPLLTILSNTVNAYPLWGVAPRMIKFTPGQWSMNFYGQCFKYFTRKLIFETKKDGWDRAILDEGTKVLNGHWPTSQSAPAEWILDSINAQKPNKNNPAHFLRYKDRRTGENTRVILDGAGKPFIPDLVTVKTSCATQSKSPSKWLVSGITNDDDTESPVILSHTEGCTWTASWEYEANAFKNITLTLVPKPPEFPGFDVWKLTIDGVPSNWLLFNSRWKPFGPNDMTNSQMNQLTILFPDDNEYPAKLSLTTGNLPGVRSIQKYEERDFLPLKIPINL